MKLSDTQMQIQAAAATHPLRLAIPPAKLLVAAREAVRKSLLAKGLIEAGKVYAASAHETWATEAGPVTYRLLAQQPAGGATAAVEAGEAAAGGRHRGGCGTAPHGAHRVPGRLPGAATAWAACSTPPRPS